MRHFIHLAAIGVGLLGWAGTAAAWHPYGSHHSRVVVVGQPLTTTTTTANVITQPATVVTQPAVVSQPVYFQPVYVQPATTTTTTPRAEVVTQPVVVQPVYVQAPQAPQAAVAAATAEPCPKQEVRIRVFVEGGKGGAVVTEAPVKVEAATVTKDKIAAMLKVAEATQKSLEEAKKTNDALIAALKEAK